MEIIHSDTLTWEGVMLAVFMGLVMGGTGWLLKKFAPRPWNGFWLSTVISLLALAGFMWFAARLRYRI